MHLGQCTGCSLNNYYFQDGVDVMSGKAAPKMLESANEQTILPQEQHICFLHILSAKESMGTFKEFR